MLHLWLDVDKGIQYSPAIRGGYVRSPPANPENPRIIDAALKRLCMILYTLKYASKTHSKDSLTHQCSNNVVICSNDKLKTVIM